MNYEKEINKQYDVISRATGRITEVKGMVRDDIKASEDRVAYLKSLLSK